MAQITKPAALSAGQIISRAPRAASQNQTITAMMDLTSNIQVLEPYHPTEVTEQDVLQTLNTGAIFIDPVLLAEVNQTAFLWYSPAYLDDGVNPSGDPASQVYDFCPWLFCISKSASRDRQRRNLFRISIDFGTNQQVAIPESELYLRDLVVSAGASELWKDLPWIREIIWTEEEKVVYEDSKTSDKAQLRLPTGSLYSEPFKRRQPAKIMRQSQFEHFATEDDLSTAINDRLFSINSSEWDNDPVATGNPTPEQWKAEPPRWMVTDIQYQKVKIPFEYASDNGLQWAPLYMMTYTLTRDSGAFGYLDARVLQDYYFLEVADDLSTKREYRSPVDGTTIQTCLLNEDGTLLADQTTADHKYGVFEIQPMIPFQYSTDYATGFLNPPLPPTP